MTQPLLSPKAEKTTKKETPRMNKAEVIVKTLKEVGMKKQQARQDYGGKKRWRFQALAQW